MLLSVLRGASLMACGRCSRPAPPLPPPAAGDRVLGAVVGTVRGGGGRGGGDGGGHPFPALAAPGLSPIRIQGRNASGAARRRRWRWEVPVCPVGQPAFGNARHRAGLFPDSARARHRGQRLPGAGSQQHCRSELEKKACPSPALSLGERLGGGGGGGGSSSFQPSSIFLVFVSSGQL